MNRACVAGVLVLVAASGCAQRRIIVTSEPSGATVHLNDQQVGQTPVEVDFTWYGVYDVRLELEGYEPLLTTGDAEAPFYEWPGIDLIFLPVPSETLVRWHYDLEPADASAEGLVQRASHVRDMLANPVEPESTVPGPP